MKHKIGKFATSVKKTAKKTRFKHVYLVGVLLFLLAWKAFWAPDVLFFIFFSIFLVFGKGKEYIRKFAPFVLLLLSYDALRGLVPLISKHVHFFEMINFDKWLFHGQLATNILQHAWYNGHLHWYDYYFYFVYMLHFLAPFIIAILIWRLRPSKYWQYVGALLALSYAGFLTFILFPAAPPWMASDMHFIPNVAKLSTLIWWGWGVHSIPTIYAQFNPNPVAAVPSLHSAYPMLNLLFVNKLFGKKYAIPFAIYPISVWIGVIYLGEHYVFDLLLGLAYATAIFFASELIVNRGWHRRPTNYIANRLPGWVRGSSASGVPSPIATDLPRR